MTLHRLILFSTLLICSYPSFGQNQNELVGEWALYKSFFPGGATTKYRIPHDTLTFYESGKFVRKIYDYRLVTQRQQNIFHLIKPIYLIEGTFRVTADTVTFEDIVFRTGINSDSLSGVSNAFELTNIDELLLRENIRKKNGTVNYGKLRQKFRRVRKEN